MSPRTIVVVVFLTIAALGSWYLARPDSQPDDTSVHVETTNQGYYLKQARILGTGNDGKLLYEIAAQHAQQHDDHRIEFTGVRIQYAPASKVPWIVSADHATLRNDTPRISLRGDVHAQSNSDTEDDETEIRTQYLEFDPERYVAETDDRVQIRIGARSLTAKGMLASLIDDRIELKSNVRGEIAP